MNRLLVFVFLAFVSACAADRECGKFCHQGMPHMYVVGSGRYLGDGYCSCTFGSGLRYEKLRVDLRRGRRYQEEE